jgi:hypothetical protein
MRIYVDSRFRTTDSASASDFTVELHETVRLPDRCRVRLHDISIPYAWRTVEAGLNQLLFLEELRNGGSARRVLTLPPGQYDGRSLATTLQALMNADHSWTGAVNPYTVSYSEQRGTIGVQLSPSLVGHWTFWPDTMLRQLTMWPGADPRNPRSFNRNLRVSELILSSPIAPYESEFVDLMTIKDMYVHTSSFGLLSNVGPSPGDTTCLAKVSVDVGYGYLVYSDGSSWEYADAAGGQLLRRISFQLRDPTGALVPLHGCDWSFCLSINDPVDFAA